MKAAFDLENSAYPKDQCRVGYVAISEHLSAERKCNAITACDPKNLPLVSCYGQQRTGKKEYVYIYKIFTHGVNFLVLSLATLRSF